jgi:hypothetical protein
MLDFSRAALAARAEPVPAGTYDLKIATAEATTSGSGHTSLMIIGEIADGPHQSRKINKSLMLASTDELRMAGLLKRGLQITFQILEAIGATDEEREAASADLMQLGRLLARRTVRVTTGITVDGRDGTRREIIVKVVPSPLDQVEQVIG